MRRLRPKCGSLLHNRNPLSGRSLCRSLPHRSSCCPRRCRSACSTSRKARARHRRFSCRAFGIFRKPPKHAAFLLRPSRAFPGLHAGRRNPSGRFSSPVSPPNGCSRPLARPCPSSPVSDGLSVRRSAPPKTATAPNRWSLARAAPIPEYRQNRPLRFFWTGRRHGWRGGGGTRPKPAVCRY